jgi:hypothetical protein
VSGPARAGRGPWLDGALVVLVLLVVGVVCGVVWSQVVDPAEFTKLARGAEMGEDQLGRRFDAEGWYVVIALVAGVATGLTLTWRRLPTVLSTTAALVVGSLGAAVLMAVTGYLLGPGDPGKALAAARVGALVPERLAVGNHPQLPLGSYLRTLGGSGVFYLAWPLGVLVGVLVVLLGRSADSPPH